MEFVNEGRFLLYVMCECIVMIISEVFVIVNKFEEILCQKYMQFVEFCCLIEVIYNENDKL